MTRPDRIVAKGAVIEERRCDWCGRWKCCAEVNARWARGATFCADCLEKLAKRVRRGTARAERDRVAYDERVSEYKARNIVH